MFEEWVVNSRDRGVGEIQCTERTVGRWKHGKGGEPEGMEDIEGQDREMVWQGSRKREWGGSGVWGEGHLRLRMLLRLALAALEPGLEDRDVGEDLRRYEEEHGARGSQLRVGLDNKRVVDCEVREQD